MQSNLRGLISSFFFFYLQVFLINIFNVLLYRTIEFLNYIIIWWLRSIFSHYWFAESYIITITRWLMMLVSIGITFIRIRYRCRSYFFFPENTQNLHKWKMVLAVFNREIFIVFSRHSHPSCCTFFTIFSMFLKRFIWIKWVYTYVTNVFFCWWLFICLDTNLLKFLIQQ